MAQTLEADVTLIHVAGGGPRITPPPGTLAETAPRRAARGRASDLLFLSVGLHTPKSASPGLIDHLARTAADAYYGTPGSVTAALREATAAVNDQLLDINQGEEGPMHAQGRLMIGVLREADLYLAQSGVGVAMIIRPGQVTHLTSEEAADRPLGLTLAPHIRFHHLEVRPGDIFILTTAPPPVWSDATLAGLSALDPAQAVDRLSAAISHDLTGLLARVHSPEASAAPSPAVEHRPQGAEQAAPIEPRTPRSERAGVFAGTGERIRQLLKPIQGGFSRLATWLTNWLNRMAPGLADPPAGTVVSTRLLAATAIVVPLIIVTIAAVVYLGRGRRDQFDEYVVQAAAAIQVAQLKGDPREARKDWESALRFLQQANEYGSSAEATSMRQQAQAALDSLDLILRLEFKPVVSGGFGSDANLTAIAASATDLYIFDEAERTIWHAWGAPERGYKIDSTFECLEGRRKFQELGSLVDIVLQTSPGALGTEGVVAVDVDGNLLYCAPEREPALAKLTAPDIGFGRIQAVDVQNDQLFVMDSVTNAVWIYSAVGGLFSGNPELYFVEEVRELGGAIDIAMAGDELFILYADGKLDRCRRFSETDPDGNPRIRVECEADPRFQDERPDHEASNRIPGAVPAKLEYSPPPEPSLFFLDTFNNGVFHYSLRLVYQGLYLPLEPFAGEISALTMGPPNDLYLAVGGQVYHTAVIR